MSSDPANPITVLLKGTATGVSLSQQTLTFPATKVGVSSTPIQFTITNVYKTPLNIGAIATTGDYSQTSTCVSPLAAAANCTVTVTFKPTATGTRTGSFSIATADFQSPQNVSLTGTGD
jgi:hypothetical protein